jgi:hypothetical protein
MPKQITAAEYEAILDAVRRHPDGASIDLVQSVLGETPRRTLQRRLSELVKQGRLAVEGRTRGALYRLPPEARTINGAAGEIPSDEAFGLASVEEYVPLSDEATRLRDLVRRPATQRRPVGYRREFLLDYRPSSTVQ